MVVVGFERAAGEGDGIALAPNAPRLVIVGWKRVFEPCHAVEIQLGEQIVEGGGRVKCRTGAPPGFGVENEIAVGTDGSAHQFRGLGVALRAGARVYLEGANPGVERLEGALGEGFGRGGERGARIHAHAIAHASAEEFRSGRLARLSQQIVEGDFDGAVGAHRGRIETGDLLKMDAQSVGVAERAAFEERSGDIHDGVSRPLVSGSGGITDEAIGGGDTNDHGVALIHDSLAAGEGQMERFGERVGEEAARDGRDFHALAACIQATKEAAKRVGGGANPPRRRPISPGEGANGPVR